MYLIIFSRSRLHVFVFVVNILSLRHARVLMPEFQSVPRWLVSHAVPVMGMMAIPTVPERASSLATAATRADAAIPEQHPAPRWPVLPLRMLPRNLEPASSTALSMPKERRTLLMMAVILGE